MIAWVLTFDDRYYDSGDLYVAGVFDDPVEAMEWADEEWGITLDWQADEYEYEFVVGWSPHPKKFYDNSASIYITPYEVNPT